MLYRLAESEIQKVKRALALYLYRKAISVYRVATQRRATHNCENMWLSALSSTASLFRGEES